jgi:hypothetical protein
MRAHRAGLQSLVRSLKSSTEFERPVARLDQQRGVARRAAQASGFDTQRTAGPTLSPKQEQVFAKFNEALQQVAQELLRIANGMAPQTPAEAAKGPTQPAPSEREEGEPGPGIIEEGGGKGPPPPQTVSGFSPVAPPGVVDPRLKGPSVPTEKKADSYPAQLPGETLAQYAMRTADKTGFNISQLGALTGMAGSLGQGPNATYAEVMDRYLNPTAYWTQADFDREKNLLAAEQALVNTVYKGPLALGSLSNDDRLYLSGMEQRVPQLGDLWHKLVSGGHTDIARAVNDTEYNLGPSAYNVSTYHGQVRSYVEDMLKKLGIPHP